MTTIKLDQLIAGVDVVDYVFSVSTDIQRYFKSAILKISYSEDISSVPLPLLTVPFVANFLPQAWALDATIEVDELDENFYNCIPNVVAGYQKMYPKLKMGGGIKFNKLVKNEWKTERVGALFSGGLDAVQTMLEHIDEKPDLISLWGADVAYDNESGWKVMHEKISAVADSVHLKNIVIRSNFRLIEDEGALQGVVCSKLGDGWWHGIKHALAFFGIVSPVAFIRQYGCLYVASSHCRAIGMATCASNPWTDNEFRAGSLKVIHDGYGYERQDKARRVVEDCKKYNLNVPLHVCWITQDGENCCACEKCFRTITELLVEGADPEKFGFAGYHIYYNFKNVVDVMRRTFHRENSVGRKDLNRIWAASRQRILERKQELRYSEFWPIFKWMLKHDFMSTKDITLPFEDRIAPYKARARKFASRIYHNVLGR